MRLPHGSRNCCPARTQSIMLTWRLRSLRFISPARNMSDTTKVTCTKLLAILFVILLLVVIPFIQWPHQYIAWVGGTDLEIEFVVTDATTNAGILGAKIAVLEGPSTFCRPSGPFDMFT